MKHESKPFREPDHYYRAQHVDVPTFEANYAKIDWSKKRTAEPVEPVEPVEPEAFGTPCEPATGWRSVEPEGSDTNAPDGTEHILYP